ncbi:MAG TPA: hypothetical protein ENN56_02215 [Firmicutes bacterium]|nr:hypothetical protein [Bacillota bacterium]
MANDRNTSALERRARSWFEFDVETPSDADSDAILTRTAALALAPSYAPGDTPPFAPSEWHTLRSDALRFVSALDTSRAERIADIAADLLTSAPLAPPLRFVDTLPEPHPPVSLIFSAWPHATHELWPIMVDALVVNGAQAVHDTWLDDDNRVRKAIRYDVEADRLIEGENATPQHPKRSLLLLGPVDNERVWHQQLDESLRASGIEVLNPYRMALIADDKWATYERWRAASVATPETRLITRATIDTAEESLRHIRQLGECVVVKPRCGTAARNVTITTDIDEALDAVRSILRDDDAIIQPFQNDLRWSGESDTAYPTVLRINVVRGECGTVRAESGYLHVAPTAEQLVASVAQFGRGRSICRNSLEIGGMPITESETLVFESIAEKPFAR